MLTVVTFWWGKKYPPHYVERLAWSLRRHISEPFKFIVAVDESLKCSSCSDLPSGSYWTGIRDLHLLSVPGCFARLRLFDPDWQKELGVSDRVVCIDLDVVVTGRLDPIVSRREAFLIIQGANASNPCPYNGSIWMLRAGYRPDVWSDFSLDAAALVQFDSFPDDQAWLADKLPNAPGWKAGAESGLYAFKKPGWLNGDDLPSDARMVVFPGWRDPSRFSHLPWVKKNWRV